MNNNSINISLTREEVGIISDVIENALCEAKIEHESMSRRNETVFPNAPIIAEIASYRAEKLEGVLGRLKNV